MKRTIISGIIIAAIFTFLIFAGGCKNKSGAAGNDYLTADSVSYKTKVLNYSDTTFTKEPDGQTSYNISYFELGEEIPQAARDSIAAYNRAFLLGESEKVEQDFLTDTLAGNFFKEYAKVRKSYGNEFPWTITKNIGVVGKLGKYLSVEYYEDSYMGGAHPNAFSFYRVFDLETGKVLAFEDVFDGAQKAKLDQLKLEYLRKERNIDTDSIKIEDVVFPESLTPGNGYLYAINNFYLTKNDVVFYYNSYDIAPYVFGPSQLEIPFTVIKPCIKANSPVLEWMGKQEKWSAVVRPQTAVSCWL